MTSQDTSSTQTSKNLDLPLTPSSATDSVTGAPIANSDSGVPLGFSNIVAPPGTFSQNAGWTKNDGKDTFSAFPNKSNLYSGIVPGRWSLKNKATLLAVALGAIPVIIIGGIATSIASNQLSENVIEQQQQLASTVNLQMQDFMTSRLRDAEALATNPLVINPALRSKTSPDEVLGFLFSYLARDSSYSAITVVEPDGGYTYLDAAKKIPLTTAEDLSATAQDPNYKFFAVRNIPYYLAVRDTLKPAVSPIRISSTTGKSSFYIAVPGFDKVTKRFIAMVYSRTVATDLSALINQRVANMRQDIQISEGNSVHFSVMDHSKAYFETTADGKDQEIVSTRIQRKGNEVIIDGQPFQPGGVIRERENRVFISNSESEIGVEMQSIFPKYAQLRERETATTIKDISALDNKPYLITYFPVPQVDSLNNDWGVLVSQPTSEVFAARQALIMTLLGGTALTSLVVGMLAAYISNRVTRPIIEASEAVTKLGQGNFNTRLVVRGNDELAVLNSNINIMANQMEAQLLQIEETAQQQGILQAQSVNAQQQKQQHEAMEKELLQLIQSIEGASKGDLTVHADLSTGEIGIVADVFNTIVESLRKIVVQVKQATIQVNTSIGSNQDSIRQLADDALSQVDEISHTLTSVQQMSASIQSVSASAQQAAKVARNASSTAQKGGQAMEQTVTSIVELRSTVAETTKKVKQLGEASQQISQVVSLINEIALKTNLLAINASIEAAHAGEEGQGFAVVAGEVGQLAEQSARATKEIERIVKNIQDGTREVIGAMELSTSQVVEGTSKLNETKESLENILSVSEEIDQLVQSISEATVSQATTSQTVTELMQQISVSSQQTSEFSRQVDSALQGTVEVAQKLELAVDKFKVGSEST